ncbi:MAG: glycosyltransferase [Pricia sp.]
MLEPAIVVVAFNRPACLKRSLSSLSNSFFDKNDVELVISIDYEDSDENAEVHELAEKFNWKFGPKRMITHDRNLGLRNHILQCGDLTDQYGSIVLLEDDVVVAPAFYNFAKQAVNYYLEDSLIGGISLYSYEYEELGLHQFYPKSTGKDTYFIQWAGSWGQVWTKTQWKGFKKWYSEDIALSAINIPDKVKHWKNSWKKYYIAYLVVKDKYFVYPYISYTTLMDDDQGTNIKSDAQVNNVRISSQKSKGEFNFSKSNNENIKYDSFFQPIDSTLFVHAINRTVEVSFDLNGTKELKNLNSPYVFTSKRSSASIEQYSNKLIPYELNLLKDERGEVFTFSRKEDIEVKRSIVSQGRLLNKSRKKKNFRELVTLMMYKILKYTGLNR